MKIPLKMQKKIKKILNFIEANKVYEGRNPKTSTI
jgi:hypothetical protein